MFKWLIGVTTDSGLKDIDHKFAQMLEDGRHVFDAAANALLGGTDPEVIREDLFKTDARINGTEQKIRRQLVIHGTVHGASHFPELLVMMSLVKDAERIGDYAKNLFDLAAHSADLSSSPELPALVTLKDKISKLLIRARNVYDEQNQPAAVGFLQDTDGLQDECDSAVHRLVAVSDRNMASEVLVYRYFKRVVSHAANVVTSLVMPVDKLDYFDEPRG